MPTISQLVRKGLERVREKTASPALESSTQKRGVCTRLCTTAPKKPSPTMRLSALYPLRDAVTRIAGRMLPEQIRGLLLQEEWRRSTRRRPA